MPDSSTLPTPETQGPMAAGAPAAPRARAAVPHWHWHRRMYDWMLSFAHSPYATWALAGFSFCEAIFFPIPPFVLQIPLTLERRNKAWYYAAVTSVSSVVGGVVGFYVGASFHGLATRLFSEEAIHQLDKYTGNLWLLIGAAIAVHPFKLFAIAAGFLGTIPLKSFVIASIVGRSALFFGIGTLLWFFGPPVRTFIDRYFNLLTIVFGVGVVAIVVAAKML